MSNELFDAFRSSMMNKPEGSRMEAQAHFVKTMRSRPMFLEILANDYFERMAANWQVKSEPTGGYSFGRTGVSRDKIERTQEQRAKSAALNAEVEHKMLKAISDNVLLNLELPNGKKLRDATGAECIKAGSFYADIGKVLKPTQVVGRHFSEQEIRNVRDRHFKAQGNAA